jgi:hypothetical protein
MQFQFQFYGWGWKKNKVYYFGCGEIFLQQGHVLSVGADAKVFLKVPITLKVIRKVMLCFSLHLILPVPPSHPAFFSLPESA